jgi:heme exporter protein D
MNFDMGSYSAYIWPAYGVSAVLLIGVTVWTLAGWKRAKARLANLEKRDQPQEMTAKT